LYKADTLHGYVIGLGNGTFGSQPSGGTHGLLKLPKATHANIASVHKNIAPIILLYKNIDLTLDYGLTG